MSGEENRALVGRLADEVLTQHNLAALDDIFHADYVEGHSRNPQALLSPPVTGTRFLA